MGFRRETNESIAQLWKRINSLEEDRNRLMGRVGGLEGEVKVLRQQHCKHEFSNKNNGCLKGIICWKCGMIHPDWKEVENGYYLEDDKVEDKVYIGDTRYVKFKKKGKKYE